MISNSSAQSKVKDLLEIEERKLNEWELDFISSMEDIANSDGEFSPKQRAKIEILYDKFFDDQSYTDYSRRR